MGTVHLIEGRTPSEEAQEIIHKLKVDQQEVDEISSGSADDFITSNDQVQTKRPVQHPEKQNLSPEMKKKLDEYLDICSKDQYDIGTSTHPPLEIPTEGPPCISAPYTIPLKFRPWADNTINKLLVQGPMLPCSCRLHTLPRLRAPQGSNLCEANSRKYRW